MATRSIVGLALFAASACGDDGAIGSGDGAVDANEEATPVADIKDAEPVDDGESLVNERCEGVVVNVIEGATVVPQTVLHLAVATPASFEVVEVAWSAEPPEGAAPRFAPSASVSSPVLPVDVAGTWRLAVAVTDARGETCRATTEVAVVSDDEIRVQLTWRTPDDPEGATRRGADVDLHVRHPDAQRWFDTDYLDCWVNNLPPPSWAVVGDRPWCEITRDDDDVPGPETILVHPEGAQRFTVGVHLRVPTTVEAVVPTVAIWVRGVLADRWEGAPLAPDELWTSHVIDWPAGTATRVEPRDVLEQVTEVLP